MHEVGMGMDSVFLLREDESSAFLHRMVEIFRCTYICLWSYKPQPSNCLVFKYGIFKEISNGGQPLDRRLFTAYSKLVHSVENCQIPGCCFKNNLPFLELKGDELQGLASSEVQLQFYEQAGIKTAVFMGCGTGEIELGMSNEPQVDLEMEMKILFSQATINIGSSSSSSSLRSLSFGDSPECFINAPIDQQLLQKQTLVKSVPNLILDISSASDHDPLQQAVKALSRSRNLKLPTIESEDAAIKNAILAVISSSSSSSCSTTYSISRHGRHDTAFQSYNNIGMSTLAPRVNPTKSNNMFKRAVLFFRNLHITRIQEFHPSPTTTQLHHMISERKRREKLNESFQILRSLLPPLGSKKDKASVLSSTTEYLSSLKCQVEELCKRNQELEAQLSNPSHETATSKQVSSSQERLVVEINRVSAIILELKITVLGECSSLLNLVILIMELLKQQRNVGLLSVQSNTTIHESTPIHLVVMTLKIEGDVFDEYAFQETVTRILDVHLSRS